MSKFDPANHMLELASGEYIRVIPDGILWRLHFRTMPGFLTDEYPTPIDCAKPDTWPESWEGVLWGNTNPVLNCAIYHGLSPSLCAGWVHARVHNRWHYEVAFFDLEVLPGKAGNHLEGIAERRFHEWSVRARAL